MGAEMELGDMPFKITKAIDWKCQNWPIEKWKSTFGDLKFEFQFGENTGSKDSVLLSQRDWEFRRPRKLLTFSEFCGRFEGQEGENTWCYSPYNYSFETVPPGNLLYNEVDWTKLGCDKNDFTLWIGSKGSFTPGHYDTYGCNLVVQLYGRKRWILFPPNQSSKMCPTRVPYEESSVFSQLHLFTYYSSSRNVIPLLKEKLKGTTPYMCILEPGDLLYVPPHWWHFVENLDMSISVNQWLDQGYDLKNQIREGIVQLLVTSLLPEGHTSREKILNTNKGLEGSVTELVKVICTLIQKDEFKYKKHKSSCENMKITSCHLNSQPLAPCSILELVDSLTSSSKYIDASHEHDPPVAINTLLFSSILNVICSDDVINMIVDRVSTEMNHNRSQ